MKSAADAVATALRLVGHGVYQLGTGDCDTPDDGPSDCVGFAICKCHDERRHQVGFNAKNPSKIDAWDVENDINSNSALGDAYGAQTKFRPVPEEPGHLAEVRGGDVIVYPTIRIRDAHGKVHVFVGHAAIVTDASKWDGSYSSLQIAQCCGPNGRTPGIIASSGRHFDDHDAIWPKHEHKTHVLRAIAG